MLSVKELQGLVDRIRGGSMPMAEIQGLLQHQSPLVRVNALEALVGAAQHDDGLLKELVAAARNPMNNVRLMGTTSVAHVAMACLFRVGTAAAVEAAKALISAWPELDRSDLIWYLKSESLSID